MPATAEVEKSEHDIGHDKIMTGHRYYVTHSIKTAGFYRDEQSVLLLSGEN